ncbi:MAG: hypothetical protein R3F54_31340 [Alphaproteobacteria bacterium]
MKHDLKARFISYAARQKHRPLDKDVPEEMDDLVFRYVNNRLGCCHIEERRLTPEELEAIEAAIAEDAASAEVVRSQIEGTLVINEILLPGMLLQWAEGMLEPAPTLANGKRPSRPMPSMHQALRYLVLEAEGEILSDEQRDMVEELLERYAGVGEPLKSAVRLAATALAESHPAIATRLSTVPSMQ